MPIPVFIFIIFVLLILLGIGLVYRRRNQSLPDRIHAQLDMIRAQGVLLKPEPQAKIFSGRFAGRLMWFSFSGKNLNIRADVKMTQDDLLWIYPVNHRFDNDKFKSNLEKNRAWTSNAEFDGHFILAGRPRVFANAVIYPARKVQTLLLKYPRAIVEVDPNSVRLSPNVRDEASITAEMWGEWIGLVADIAELVEAQYTPSMFAGIEVDENAYPDHSRGHMS